MTRKIKEIFLKYFRSNLAWNVVKFFAMLYNYIIRIFRIFQYLWFNFWPLLVWNKSTYSWINKFWKQFKWTEYKRIVDSKLMNIPYSLKINLNSTPKNFKWYYKEPKYDQFVAKIPKWRIIWTYTPVTPNRYILWDSCWYPNEHLYSNPYTYYPNISTFEKVSWNIALLSSNDSYKNYYHYMTYVLPKYYLFKKSWIQIDRFATDYDTKYHKESVEALWISEDKIIKLNNNSRLETENLVIASTFTLKWNLSIEVIEFIKSLFLKVKCKENKRRLYISRINNRKVINEEEILNLLENFWFEKVILDNLSVKEQAELFDSAEFVIWPHGAWLTNLIFCKPWTKILELFHKETLWWHYFCLSNSCKLNYNYLIWEIIRNNKRIKMDQDIYIDIWTLEQKIKALGI